MVVLMGLCATAAEAKVTLPQLFQNGMVLQRNQPITVWGKADVGETVTLEFKGKTYTATAAEDGRWTITMPKQKHGGPFTMTVNEHTLSDVMVGDVWICSGQSNIDTNIERVYPQYTKDIDSYSTDKVRLFQVPTHHATERLDDVRPTKWQHLSKQNAWKFSALGYFLGQRMLNETGVPQGIIQCSLGGSPIQSWIDIDSLKIFPADYYNKYLLYTDPQYVKAQSAANNIANEVWTRQMNNTDPGFGKYEKADYDDSQWPKHSQYDNNQWARHNGRPIIGSMWLRQHITVDAAHAGKPATLLLGTFHDMDYTYVNGQQVGVTYYQYPPRRYKIPAGLLKEGDNVISVRLINKSGMANFYRDKPHKIVYGEGDEQEISTDWLTQKGSLIMEGPLGGKIDTQNQASVLYNGMLRPLAPYAIQGIVWYQGESNTGRPQEYESLLKIMIGNWRTLWNRDDLSFSVVQLANYMQPSERPQDSGWSRLRESQRLVAAADPYTTLAVAIDLGEAADIHPLRKREVAERCALGLENTVFGKKNVLSAEPVQAVIRDGKVVVTMDQLMREEGKVAEFELAGSDGRYHNATAAVRGTEVTITCDAVQQPRSVRYAWKNNPDRANLYGRNSLPASPFQIAIK